MIIVVALLLIAIGIFVAYRSAGNTAERGMRIIQFMSCCYSSEFARKHLASDWLLGTWIVFWATFIGNIMFFLYFMYELSHIRLNNVALFIYIMRYNLYIYIWFFISYLIDMRFLSVFNGLMFLAGAAYFVAGKMNMYILILYHLRF